MSPIKVFAATALSIGLVAAAGIAGFAVVNSSITSAATDSITLLANESSTGQAPFYQPGDLPAVVTFDQAQTVATSSGETSAQSTTTTLITTQPNPAASIRETPNAVPSEITALQARSAVLAQVNGTVVATTEVTRKGYEAFAVKVNLADGSIATGYVDKKSGVVFDWDVVGAPATPGNSGGSAGSAPVAPQPATHKEDDKKDSHKEGGQKSDSKPSGSTSSHDRDGDDD